jgi:hypothetical protein
MRFDYRLAPEDIREAMWPARADGRPVARNRFGRAVLGWVLFVALALLLVYVETMPTHVPGRSGLRRIGPLPEPPPPQNLWVTLLPSAVPAAMMVLLVLAGMGQQALRTRRVVRAVAAGTPVPPAQTGRALGGILGLALVGLMSPLLLYDLPAVAVPWRPTPSLAMWVAFSPWVVAFAVLVVALAQATRRAADRLWATNPALRRELSADVSDIGVWTTDGVTDTLHRWPGFKRYRETDSLLVLTLEDTRLLILPKRALPDAATSDQLRGLIQTHVAEGTFLPRTTAFEVLPVAGAPNTV